MALYFTHLGKYNHLSLSYLWNVLRVCVLSVDSGYLLVKLKLMYFKLPGEDEYKCDLPVCFQEKYAHLSCLCIAFEDLSASKLRV